MLRFRCTCPCDHFGIPTAHLMNSNPIRCIIIFKTKTNQGLVPDPNNI